jgi:hypothetical protein
MKKTEATRDEVQRLLDAKFIEPIDYPTWLDNGLIVKKKNDKGRTCINFTSLNKAHPKDDFPTTEDSQDS